MAFLGELREFQKEEWKAVCICKEYAVSSLGRVKRVEKGFKNTSVGRISHQSGNRYPFVHLTIGFKRVVRVYVHTLVARAFLGVRPSGYQINHKDGNKQNNSIKNLEYMTPQDNIKHSVKLGLVCSGERCGASKLTKKDVCSIREMRIKGHTLEDIGVKFRTSISNVWWIVNNQTWRTNV